MQVQQAVILGIVQGLTEFLPISSSGHLVIFQHLFGLKKAELFFDVSVHLGTLLAVVFFFRKELATLLMTLVRSALKLVRNETVKISKSDAGEIHLAVRIIVASIPTAIIGLYFHGIAEQLFASINLTGAMLAITGAFLWLTARLPKDEMRPNGDSQGIGSKALLKAVAIGGVQGLAILPGISRSGSTIAAGLLMGLDRQTATKFSFLLSIPAILGATALMLIDTDALNGFDFRPAIIGAMVSACVGYLSLKLLVFMVNRGRLYIFAPYCWVAAGAALLLGW